MRRRILRQPKQRSKRAKPVATGLYTTAIICSAWLLWYLNYLFLRTAYSCRDYAEFWLGSQPGRPTLLLAASLFALALLTWLYVDIVRPKTTRVPVTLRIFQLATVTSILLINIMLSGYFNLYSPDGRIHAYMQEQASRIPVIGPLFLVLGHRVQIPDSWVDEANPHYETYRNALQHYDETFARRGITYEYGMVNGQLECEASRDIEEALEAAYRALWAEYQLKDATIRVSEPEFEGPSFARKPQGDTD